MDREGDSFFPSPRRDSDLPPNMHSPSVSVLQPQFYLGSNVILSKAAFQPHMPTWYGHGSSGFEMRK